MTSRGRPRNFDRQLALQAMMDVFWMRGYEGAQLTDLTAAAGINPPSFYAAFGSKEAAFCEAVDHYVATVGNATRMALEQPVTLRESLRKMLISSIDVALSQHSGGCMLILGVVNCLPASEGVREYLRQARQNAFDILKARIERARTEGELSRQADVEQLATFFWAIVQSISFQARDGASRQTLESLIEPALRIID
ncbi:TetR/AcrR family transcriptional regulator [Superficieibacter sp. BNK-5]|uniref:TetR/AcrR family transcriptional regulator n=1 Tax=Superficieibacter sp. BNK-5 TaxID=3376142 RepID=UPI0039BF9136